MRFARPETIEDAARMLAAEPGVTRILTGGTDVMVQMRAGLAAPALVVDVKHLTGLRAITPEAGGYRIGAAVPGAVMGEHAGLRALWPGVVEGVELIGSTQVQGRATMAGNLCNGSPAADAVPGLVAADAVVRIMGVDGARDCPVIDIPAGPGRTTLAKGDIVTSIFLPARPARSGDAYLRFTPRSEMDIAVVSAAVSLTLGADGAVTAARVALGAVAPTVLLVDEAAQAIIGTRLDDAALAALAAACSAACRPIDDKRGTVAFRTQVAGVLARRAASIARDRAHSAGDAA
ncbi:MAG: xanthine dehydrogenase family protein subunit M [Rhodobacterales bacterium]|nr:xanthine dehydrogenase family protein subunit M [Rhodobacterales bacterium]NCT13470.1 xanthine dehydrogenase family protein subunit M [Rhodobacterales bacterium]